MIFGSDIFQIRTEDLTLLKTMNPTVFRPGLEIKLRDKMMELFPNGGHSGILRGKSNGLYRFPYCICQAASGKLTVVFICSAEHRQGNSSWPV
jgi:hypothetical protein